MLAIGDAIAFAITPAKHVQVWSFRRQPQWYGRATSALVAHRGLGLGAAAAELGLGIGLIALASRYA